MGFVEAVQLIGDRITEIDVAIARLAPSDPNAAALEAKRAQLDEQQRILVKQAFDENSQQFQTAAAELDAVNKEIGESIQDIENIATVIDNVTKLLNTVTNLVTTAVALK